MDKREAESRLPIEDMSSHSTKKFCSGTLCCLETFWYQTIFMDKKEEETRLSVEKMLSHSSEKFREGSFLFVFQKISGIEKC